MNLKCKIHGKEFPIVQGVTFSEEYNETLDSGSLIITHVSKIRKLRPYNDVFVYDNVFNGFGENLNPRDHNKFYKHMLVQNFTEEILNLKDKIYKYKISLMSEIKALEKVQLPNISVTQPLKAKYKISIYEYLVRFVKMYSPKYKRVIPGTNKWEYTQKYTVDPKLEEIFGNVYSPDFTLNLPTLRDLISKLMIVKDMIPYVEDNVIKAMDITARKNEFVLDEKHMNYITGSMHNEDYCTGLRRNYSDALSQDSTCRSIEYIGFRNSNSALMTLGNMQLETRFPIYKINKILMCYYKKSNIGVNKGGEITPQIFLCKQDITPLVKLNTERNVLSRDWDKFNKDNPPKSIEEMSQYKMCTVGYDIGSKYITGWGTQYKYPIGWWEREKTYIENIVNKLDLFTPFGVENFKFFYDNLKSQNIDASDIIPTGDIAFENAIISPFSNKALDLKSMIFIIDYQGFYNGAIETSKDNIEDDGIVSNDNSSSSLALLELDGLSQKEKANRFGNKTIQISARYEDISQMQNLGDVYNNEDDTDVIIYHREYSIYDNLVNCIYFGVKDYVLKNYFTSVFARHRTWNLIPYSESVRRSENKKLYLTLSKEKSYYEENNDFNFDNLYDSFSTSKLLLSAFLPSKVDDTGVFDDYLKINYGFITHNNNYYLSEVNSFLNGYSLCFNISMPDNISMGNYIENISPFDNETDFPEAKGEKFSNLLKEWFYTHDDFTGSVQNWYSIVDNEETGFTKKLGFYLAHQDNNTNIYSTGMFGSETGVYYAYNNYLLQLPKIEKTGDIVNKIGQEFDVYKDNKELIDMTYQIEPISLDENVLFSSWLMKLNDLLSNYHKLNNNNFIDYTVPAEFLGETNKEKFIFYSTSFANEIDGEYIGYVGKIPYFVVSIPKENVSHIKALINQNIKIKTDNIKVEYDCSQNYANMSNEELLSYIYIPTEIVAIEDNFVEIIGNQKTGIKYGISTEDTIYCEDKDVKIRLQYINNNEDTNNNYYYAMISKIITKDENGYNQGLSKTKYEYNYNTLENVGDGPIYLTNGFEKTSDNPPTTIPPASMYNSQQLNYMWGKHVKTTKFKNMYLVLSCSSLKNTLVYDEYTEENIPYIISFKDVSEIFEVTNNYINVNLKNLRNKGYKFNDTITTTNVINPPASDTDDSYESIYLYCSFTSQDGVVYDRIELDYDTYNGLQMYYREEKSNVNTNVYNQYTGWVDEKYRLLKEDIVYNTANDLNNFSKNEFDEWKTKNLEKQILDLTNVKSIQYWYKDIKEEIIERFEFKDTNLLFTPFHVKDSPIIIKASFKDNYNNEYVGIVIHSPDLETGQITLEYEKVGSEFITVYDNGKWLSKEYKTIKNVVLNTNHASNEATQEQLTEWLIGEVECKTNATRYYDENLMKFVFGVNLSEQDKENGYVKIYTSLITNRNPNVYDENYNIVGKVHNYANNEDFAYGEDQYYDEEDID